MNTDKKVTINKLPTGVPGLDEIVGGGLPEYSFNMEFLEKRMWSYACLNSGLTLALNGREFKAEKGLFGRLFSRKSSPGPEEIAVPQKKRTRTPAEERRLAEAGQARVGG